MLSRREEIEEWSAILKFVAACRRQWPGAMIVLRPDTDAASRCNANPHPKPSTGHEKENHHGR